MPRACSTTIFALWFDVTHFLNHRVGICHHFINTLFKQTHHLTLSHFCPGEGIICPLSENVARVCVKSHWWMNITRTFTSDSLCSWDSRGCIEMGIPSTASSISGLKGFADSQTSRILSSVTDVKLTIHHYRCVFFFSIVMCPVVQPNKPA